MKDRDVLPPALPVPQDNGAAQHLPGTTLPALELPTSDGGATRLDALGPGRTIIYAYPLTRRPGEPLPEGWDAIPGARGCTNEACAFRDHFADLRASGVTAVFGLSGQNPAYQAEAVGRLHLPFTMLSDEHFALADALNLPTFHAPGQPRLYSRLTLVVLGGVIEHVFYPIFPPDKHPQQVLTWLRFHTHG